MMGLFSLPVSGVGNPKPSLRAIGGSDVGQLVDVATAPIASALRVDGLHDIAGLDSLGEHAKARSHAQSRLRSTSSMPKRMSGRSQPKRSMASFHGMRCSGNSCSTPAASRTSLNTPSIMVDDVVLLNERHLDVDLSELRLAVGRAGPRRGSSEQSGSSARCQPTMSICLNCCGLCGSAVELARVGARRNQVVASAFGRGVRQDWRFDLEEATLVERPCCIAWATVWRSLRFLYISGRRRSM